jgi:taurine dioxygenase
MSTQIKPLDEPFGCEVSGLEEIDLTEPEVQRVLYDALHQYLVLIIRNQRLGTDGQVRLTRLFGEPEMAWDRRSHHPDSPYIQVMNSAARPVSAARSSSQFWHTDGSFLPHPPSATLLAIQHLPDSGGDTLFADTRSAYESLPDEFRTDLLGLELRFSYRYLLHDFQTAKYGPDENTELEDHPDVFHPLIRSHPVTGRGSIYIDQLCVAEVVGKSAGDSRKLLDFLYSHTIVPERIYQHLWLEGDLLIWDNPSLMHRRGENHSGMRLLYRTTATGPTPIPLTVPT